MRATFAKLMRNLLEADASWAPADYCVTTIAVVASVITSVASEPNMRRRCRSRDSPSLRLTFNRSRNPVDLFAAADPGAIVGAILIAAVTVGTDAYLHRASRAIVESV